MVAFDDNISIASSSLDPTNDDANSSAAVLPKSAPNFGIFELLPMVADGIDCAIVCPATVLLCVLFWRLVRQTSILHPNLKCLLNGQSVYVFLFAVLRIFAILSGIEQQFSPSLLSNFIHALIYSLIVFGNFVGHLIIIERIVATAWAKTYERIRNFCAIGIGMFIVALLSLLNAFYQFYVLDSIFITPFLCYLTQIFATVSSFLEIFIICLLTSLNKRKFNDTNENSCSTNGQYLSTKYQLVENIRTGRQLGPPFFFHFVGISISFVVVVVIPHFQLCTTDFSLFVMCVRLAVFLQGTNNFLTLFSTIKFHPILCRIALKEVQKYVKCAVAMAEPSNPGDYLNGITQRQIPFNADMDIHFQQLQRCWEIDTLK